MKIGPHEIYKMYLLKVKRAVSSLGSQNGQVRKVLAASEEAAIESIKLASRPNKNTAKIQKEIQRQMAEPAKKLDVY